MLSVAITSLNPAKIKAVESAFQEAFPSQAFHFEGVKVSSDVADQPMSSEETKQGALNRIANAKLTKPEFDYYVGIEAGLDGALTFAWMIVESGNMRGESRSASLMLPSAVLKSISEGLELGDAMDTHYATQNIKQKGGAIAQLTGHLLTRSSVYHQALILALIPFINPQDFIDNNFHT